MKTLLIAAALVAVAGMIRDREDFGLHPDAYWGLKMGWYHNSDMIIGGDSRACIGVSPEHLAEISPGLRIRNFGYFGSGYSQEYLETLYAVLDPDSHDRRVLLCITPFSLTEMSAGPDARTQFTMRRPPSRMDAFLYKYGNGILFFFEPLLPKDLIRGLFPQLKSKSRFKEWHADGWLAYRTIPAMSGNSLDGYAKMFTESAVTEEHIDRVVEFTRKAVADGVRVYGLRPPTEPEMVELETRMSGFDEEAFVARFEEAGGKWINIDPTGLKTYDYSHLSRDSAIRFSDMLAKKIMEQDSGGKSSRVQRNDG